jgi:hypothetical protein
VGTRRAVESGEHQPVCPHSFYTSHVVVRRLGFIDPDKPVSFANREADKIKRRCENFERRNPYEVVE